MAKTVEMRTRERKEGKALVLSDELPRIRKGFWFL
jgi:hypothetical protein